MSCSIVKEIDFSNDNVLEARSTRADHQAGLGFCTAVYSSPTPLPSNHIKGLAGL